MPQFNDSELILDKVPDYSDIPSNSQPVCKSEFDSRINGTDSTCIQMLPPSVTMGTKSAQLTRQGGWLHKKFLETDVIYSNSEILNLTNGAKIKNIFHEYQLRYTLVDTGYDDVATGDKIELSGSDLPAQFELQRTHLHFSDESMKTFSVKAYGHKNGTSNANIMSASNHYNQDYEDTISRIFLMPNKIQILIDGTANKTVDITIFLKELFQFQGD